MNQVIKKLFCYVLFSIICILSSCMSGQMTYRQKVKMKENFELEIEKVKSQTITPNCTQSPTGKGSPMCEVPAGPFLRGCNESVDYECRDHEFPFNIITLDTFWIDRHEVTVDQYAKCVSAGVCKEENLQSPLWDTGPKPERAEFCNWGKEDKENHPINCVSWSDAKTYCKWVGKRLATEAEWEKAARGVDGRLYPWGNKRFKEVEMVANIADITASRHYDGGFLETAMEYGWYCPNYDDGYYLTSPVETFVNGVSPYGLFDMAGNVDEWVYDWHSETWHADSDTTNPVNKKPSKYKVLKGGSWDINVRLLRTSSRGVQVPECRDGGTGIRCAYSQNGQ